MDKKVSTILERALQEKSKGYSQKALKRLEDAIRKFPGEIELYLEAADVCLEGGETLQSTQFLKRAQARFRSEQGRIDTFAREKLRSLKDPVLGKFLLENSIKKHALDEAVELLDELQDRTVRDLLQRTRIKKQSLTSAAHGGHALKMETLINTMSEALLYLRMGRIKEAVRAFLQILDEKSVENEILEPFFAGLEKKFPKAGRIKYAYACSLLTAQQYEKAVSRLVEAMKLEPRIGDDCLERVRELTAQFEVPPEPVKQALVEMLLVTGDLPQAAELLRESLAAGPGNARGVLELVRPYMEKTEHGQVLHYLYLEAALIAAQTARAIEALKSINEDPARRSDLYAWLEKTSRERFLPSEVMVFHGGLAIEVEDFDRAFEIFEAVAKNSHADVPAIVNILEKYKDKDPRFVDFLEAHKDTQPAVSGYDDGGLEFEHFGNNDFKFSSKPSGDSRREILRTEEPEDPAGEKPVEPSDLPATETAASPKETVHAAIDSDFIWDEEDETDAGPPLRSAGPPEETPEEESWLETNNDTVIARAGTIRPPRMSLSGDRAVSDPAQPPAPDDVPEDDTPVCQIDEAHVRNLAQALGDAGAALFFHLEGTDQEAASSQPNDEPAGTVETAAADTSETADAAATEVADATEAAAAETAETATPGTPETAVSVDDEPSGTTEDDEFERRFVMFLDGALDNDSITGLLRDAAERGRIEELRELLYFEPANPEQEYVRKSYQIEYYVLKDLPAKALELIDAVNVDDLAPENKKELLVKKASCLQRMSDFESAHQTYVQLLDEYSCPEIEHNAKRNYERYLEDQCDRKPVLEKTTTLYGD